MLQLLIIRHANPIYETDSITEKGERQASLLAERIKRLETIHALYVSPLGRAIKTAGHIARATGIKPKELQWLKEVDRGDYPWCKPHNEYLKAGRFADLTLWEDEYWAGNELRQVYEEVSSGLDKLLSEYGYERKGFIYKVKKTLPACSGKLACPRKTSNEVTICLVCHGGVSIVMLSHLLQWHLPLSYAHVSILETGTARVHFKEQGENDAVPVLITLNEISHFDDELWEENMTRQKDHHVAM